MERCIFITYIQDNTLNIYINHYCVSYTTPNFRLDQFDLKYSHQAETSLCFIPKASAHGSFAGYEIERPQYQRENVCVCILEKVLEEEAYLEGFCWGTPISWANTRHHAPDENAAHIHSWWDCQSFQGCRSIVSITPGRINAGRWKAA